MARSRATCSRTIAIVWFVKRSRSVKRTRLNLLSRPCAGPLPKRLANAFAMAYRRKRSPSTLTDVADGHSSRRSPMTKDSRIHADRNVVGMWVKDGASHATCSPTRKWCFSGPESRIRSSKTSWSPNCQQFRLEFRPAQMRHEEEGTTIRSAMSPAERPGTRHREATCKPLAMYLATEACNCFSVTSPVAFCWARCAANRCAIFAFRSSWRYLSEPEFDAELLAVVARDVLDGPGIAGRSSPRFTIATVRRRPFCFKIASI